MRVERTFLQNTKATYILALIPNYGEQVANKKLHTKIVLPLLLQQMHVIRCAFFKRNKNCQVPY